MFCAFSFLPRVLYRVTSTAGRQMFHGFFSGSKGKHIARSILFSQMLSCMTSTSKPPIEVSVYEKRNHLFGVQFLLLSKPQECCVCLEQKKKKDAKLNAEKQFKMRRSFGCLSCTFWVQHGDFLEDHGWEKYTMKNSLTHRPACCTTLM